MPYIGKELRECWDEVLEPLLKGNWIEFATEGELNYIITKILLRALGKKSYTNYNRLIGVLECVKLELNRRGLSKHEDKKILENGDIEEYVERFKVEKEDSCGCGNCHNVWNPSDPDDEGEFQI